MHSSTFGKGWVGMSAFPLVVLACESLHVCTVCIWRCEHARFCVEVFYALYINFHSFIHSFTQRLELCGHPGNEASPATQGTRRVRPPRERGESGDPGNEASPATLGTRRDRPLRERGESGHPGNEASPATKGTRRVRPSRERGDGTAEMVWPLVAPGDRTGGQRNPYSRFTVDPHHYTGPWFSPCSEQWWWVGTAGCAVEVSLETRSVPN